MHTLVGGFVVHVHKLTDLLSERTAIGNCMHMKEKHFTTDSPERRQGHFIFGPTDDQVYAVHKNSSRAAQYAQWPELATGFL